MPEPKTKPPQDSICFSNDVNGRHAWWSIMRFAWPWGLLFPNVTRCLYCGAKPTRRDRRARASS